MQEYTKKVLRTLSIAETFTEDDEAQLALAALRALAIGADRLVGQPDADRLVQVVNTVLASFKQAGEHAPLTSCVPKCACEQDEADEEDDNRLFSTGITFHEIEQPDPSLVVLRAHLPHADPTTLRVRRGTGQIRVDAEGHKDDVTIRYGGEWMPLLGPMLGVVPRTQVPTNAQLADAQAVFDPTNEVLEIRVPTTPLTEVPCPYSPAPIPVPTSARDEAMALGA